MKVYANIRCASRETDTAPVSYRIDYVFMVGTKRSDSTTLIPTNYSNESTLLWRLKQGLVSHLANKYAPETFAASDILLFGG